MTSLRRINTWAAVAVILATAVGCRKGPSRQNHAASIVAHVGGRALTSADVYAALYPQSRPAGVKVDRTAARRVLDQLIDRQLVLGWAAANRVRVTDADVATRVGLVEADYGPRGFESYLKAQKLTAAQFRDKVREDLLVEGAVEVAVVEKISVGFDDIVAYYNAHAAAFEVPAEYHLKQIITDDKTKSEEVLAKINYGGAFEDVAREVSLSPERYAGGDIGYTTLAALPAEVAAAVEKLSPGQMSGVIVTPYGYEIVKVVGVRAAGRRSVEDVRTEIEENLRAEREAALYTRWLAELRRATKIVIDEKALAAL